MTTFLFRRFMHALVVVAISTSLGFFVLHIVPGDPLHMNTTQSGRSAETLETLRKQYRLDQPLTQQYAHFVSQAVRGDWGTSLVDGQPVAKNLRDALSNSLTLSGMALLLAIFIGIAVGSLQGWKGESRLGRTLGNTLTALYVVPEFIVAIVLITLLAYQLALFPVGGLSNPVLEITGTTLEQVRDRLWHLALPALTLAVGWSAAVARQQRNSIVEISKENFVRTARAKGVRSLPLFVRHAFLPSLTPLVVVIGLMLPVLVGGSVIVETLFAWPGVGSLLLKSITLRDYPVVSAAIVLTGVVVSLGTVLADAMIAFTDPRLRATLS
ncbi:MAG: ABC transporter permease [Gemmatimonadaceae bacterium]